MRHEGQQRPSIVTILAVAVALLGASTVWSFVQQDRANASFQRRVDAEINKRSAQRTVQFCAILADLPPDVGAVVRTALHCPAATMPSPAPSAPQPPAVAQPRATAPPETPRTGPSTQPRPAFTPPRPVGSPIPRTSPTPSRTPTPSPTPRPRISICLPLINTCL